jgi:hypothetical protein
MADASGEPNKLVRATIIAAIIGAAATIGTAIYLHGSTGSSTSTTTTFISTTTSQPADTTTSSPFGPAPAVYTSLTSGAGGSTVDVSGKNFPANTPITIMIGAEQVGSTTSDSGGTFANVAVTVPTFYSKFAPDQQTVIASTPDGDHATTPFEITG